MHCPAQRIQEDTAPYDVRMYVCTYVCRGKHSY